MSKQSNQTATPTTLADPLVAALVASYPEAVELPRSYRSAWPALAFIRETGSTAAHTPDPDQDPDEIPRRILTTLESYPQVAVYARGQHVVSWRDPPTPDDIAAIASAIKGGPGRHMHPKCKTRYTALAVVPVEGELHRAQLAHLVIEGGKVVSVTPVQRHEPEHLAYAIEKMKHHTDDYGSEIQLTAWSL